MLKKLLCIILVLFSQVFAFCQASPGDPVSVDIAVSDDFIILRIENVGLENMTGRQYLHNLGWFDVTDVLFSDYLCINSSVEIYRPKSETMSSVETLYLEYNTTTIDYFPVGDSRLVEINLGLPGDEYIASQYDFTLYTVNLHHIFYYDIPVGANITIDYEDHNLVPYSPIIDDEGINGSERLYFYGSRIIQTYKVFTHPVDRSTNNLLDQIDALENNLGLYANEIIELNTEITTLASHLQNLTAECNSYKVESYIQQNERDENRLLAQEYLARTYVLGFIMIITIILIPIAYLKGKRG